MSLVSVIVLGFVIATIAGLSKPLLQLSGRRLPDWSYRAFLVARRFVMKASLAVGLFGFLIYDLAH